MRVAFMGSPAFAVPALDAIAASGHEIVAVYCQKPKPAGRGHRLRQCAVHERAEALGLEIRCPERLRSDPAAQAAFAALDLDLGIVAAYGLILPQAMLDAPRLGCWNIHASLLPRWRGAAPMQAAILAGDTETGVTIMQMDAGLDTGAMLLADAVPITAETTIGTVHDDLAALGAHLLLQAMEQRPTPVSQPEHGATYAAKLTHDDGVLDWHKPAQDLHRSIRALNPWPGTSCLWGEERLKILAADIENAQGAPGTVLDDRLLIACGTQALRIKKLQRAGRSALAAQDFLRGQPIPTGTIFL